jgi:UDP-GlcNAc:undecaprenyl-phosphate GlcNAc-1-phosphate transferase
LIYNFNPATTFMGDMGSMVLGFILAVLAIKLDFNVPADRQIITGMVPILVLGVPIFDTVLVVFTRLRERRSPMKGGKDHTSHRLCSIGLSQKMSVLFLYAMSAVLGIAAIELSRTNSFDGLNLMFRLVLIAAGAFFFLEYVYIRTRQKARKQGES